jgi:TonB family protein
VRRLVYGAAFVLAGASRLTAQAANDTAFALRGCESRVPVMGPMTADGIVAAMLGADGRIDTATTRVLQVESVSVAAYRSAAARYLSTCRYRTSGAKGRYPLPVVIALAFARQTQRAGPAEQVPQLDAGIAPAPVLIPTQDLPLEPIDRRIEEFPMPLPGCSPTRTIGTRVYSSLAAARRDINAQLAEIRGNIRVELEVDRDGTVVPSSVVLVSYDNPNVADTFVEALRKCRFIPARIGGIPVPFKLTMGMGAGGAP